MSTFIAICGTVAGLIILLNTLFLVDNEPTDVFQQFYILLGFGIGGGLILLSAIIVNTKKKYKKIFIDQRGGLAKDHHHHHGLNK